MSRHPVLELQGVTREFPGEPPVRALDGIDLTIPRGEASAVVGPSGSGKSTLLNIMGTLDRPTSGTVAIDGIALEDQTDRDLCGIRATALGFVFQQFHLLEHVSAVENVAMGLLYRGSQREYRLRHARRALELVGLAKRAATPAAKLSGGQRQRVAIARALVGRPALMLADEPTGNLDSATSQEIVDLLRRLNREEGATIVVITHDESVADQFDRRVHVIDGRVVSDRRSNAPATL